jgi:hypothetical protein
LTKLKSIGKHYLDEICVIGRTALLYHYNNLSEDSTEVRSIVDNLKLSQVYSTELTGGEYEHLYRLLHEYKKDLLEANNKESYDLCPFSNLFITGTEEYEEDSKITTLVRKAYNMIQTE